MKEFLWLISKTFLRFLIDDSSQDKKAKDTTKYVTKKTKFEDYKNCLEAKQIGNKKYHLEKNEIGVDSKIS